MKLDDLIEKYKQVILKHYQEGKLLATKKDLSDPDEPLDLDESNPCYVDDEYNNADVDGSLVYNPHEFSKDNHNGQTKNQILESHNVQSLSTAGYEIALVEDLPNIPREASGQEKGKEGHKRKQFEAGKSPEDYLAMLQNDPQYQHEQGQILEMQIIYAIQYLEKHNQVIDDYAGNGSLSHQIGSYFKSSCDVPHANWARGSRRAYLGKSSPGLADSARGLRSWVRG